MKCLGILFQSLKFFIIDSTKCWRRNKKTNIKHLLSCNLFLQVLPVTGHFRVVQTTPAFILQGLNGNTLNTLGEETGEVRAKSRQGL